nr:hypothetical protein HK105_003513 [Polyrhizophydium stewartii]
MHTSSTTPTMKESLASLLFMPRYHPDFQLSLEFIPNVRFENTSMREHSAAQDALPLCWPSPLQLPDFAKEGTQVVLLHHTLDGQRLVIAVQTRRKDAAVAKQDRKKTPSDDSFSDFEIREFDANVLDILVNEYSVMSSTQGDLPALLLKMQQAFDLIFSEFRIEENVSDLPATPSAAESQRPKSIPKEDMQPASVDEFQHLYVIPDKAIDILPLEILLSKYFPKVTSVSRDFSAFAFELA